MRKQQHTLKKRTRELEKKKIAEEKRERRQNRKPQNQDSANLPDGVIEKT
jgi:hypothetical protein